MLADSVFFAGGRRAESAAPLPAGERENAAAPDPAQAEPAVFPEVVSADIETAEEPPV